MPIKAIKSIVYQQFCQQMIFFASFAAYNCFFEGTGGGHVGVRGIYVCTATQISKMDC